jgi:hypothetical protein
VSEPTLATTWQLQIPGFNVAEPVTDVTTVYVSSIGFVGAIDLNVGEYKWKHDGLYDNGEFNSFERATLNGDVVLFKDSNHRPDSVISIDKRTGEILEPAYVRDRMRKRRRCGDFAATREDCN